MVDFTVYIRLTLARCDMFGVHFIVTHDGYTRCQILQTN